MALTKDFVYLNEVDPTIIENLFYYKNVNFLGKQVNGYESNRAILTKEAAIALSQVQKALLNDGYSLVVYDAYRPEKAVKHFVEWSKDEQDQIQKELYYPLITKKDLFALGYICEESAHSRGSTVDISIIKLHHKLHDVKSKNRKLYRSERSIPYLDDGTVDMGSSVDLFDDVSHHDTNLIGKKFLKKRNYLREMMKKYGFNEFQKEWWHYTLKNEPFPDNYFDFDVK